MDPSKPADEASARGRAWLDEKQAWWDKGLMPNTVDPLDGMTIHVKAPDAQLLRGGGIHVANLFIDKYFEVTIGTAAQRMRFEVNLPEWLPALAKYLRAGMPARVNELLFTGEDLGIERSGDLVRVRRQDMDSRESVWLTLTPVQLRALHRRLVAELIVAAHRAANGFVELDGLELLHAEIAGTSSTPERAEGSQP